MKAGLARLPLPPVIIDVEAFDDVIYGAPSKRYYNHNLNNLNNKGDEPNIEAQCVRSISTQSNHGPFGTMSVLIPTQKVKGSFPPIVQGSITGTHS